MPSADVRVTAQHTNSKEDRRARVVDTLYLLGEAGGGDEELGTGEKANTNIE